MKTCSWCSSDLPRGARTDARFCSGACRVASHRSGRRSTSVPVELRSRTRWVRWSNRKVPLTVAGRPASSTNPATWSSWAEVSNSDAGVGVGFVLNGDGIVCLDLDHCLVDGALTAWAQGVLDRCPATYVEVSPSGAGLHIWGRSELSSGRVVRVPGGSIEMYPSGRYITVTGCRYRASVSRLGDLSAVTSVLLG